jgi:uncharacterized protein YjbJ (UPF0337 family)
MHFNRSVPAALSGPPFQELAMGVNKDQVKGRVNEAEGKVKEVVGKIVGNENLEVRGAVQKTLGVVQGKLGDIKEDVKKSTKGT